MRFEVRLGNIHIQKISGETLYETEHWEFKRPPEKLKKKSLRDFPHSALVEGQNISKIDATKKKVNV